MTQPIPGLSAPPTCPAPPLQPSLGPIRLLGLQRDTPPVHAARDPPPPPAQPTQAGLGPTAQCLGAPGSKPTIQGCSPNVCWTSIHSPRSERGTSSSIPLTARRAPTASGLQAFILPADIPLSRHPSPAAGRHHPLPPAWVRTPHGVCKAPFSSCPTPNAPISPFSSLPGAVCTRSLTRPPTRWNPSLPPKSPRLLPRFLPAGHFLLPCLQSTPPNAKATNSGPASFQAKYCSPTSSEPEAWLRTPPQVLQSEPPFPRLPVPHRCAPPNTPPYPATWQGPQGRQISAALR